MEIRPYAEADESAVIALWHACGLTRPWNDPRKDIGRKLGVQRELFLVGFEDEALIASAMAGYDGHRGWVNYLAVAPAHRGRGHATQLMTRLEAQLRAVGCPKLSLLVRAANTPVLEFYRKLGYLTDDAIPLGKRLIVDAPSTAAENPANGADGLSPEGPRKTVG
jgi:ribosomal protein S18 acetylase RimI-like enzyme